jgi:hypothetical protein
VEFAFKENVLAVMGLGEMIVLSNLANKTVGSEGSVNRMVLASVTHILVEMEQVNIRGAKVKTASQQETVVIIPPILIQTLLASYLFAQTIVTIMAPVRRRVAFATSVGPVAGAKISLVLIIVDPMVFVITVLVHADQASLVIVVNGRRQKLPPLL